MISRIFFIVAVSFSCFSCNDINSNDLDKYPEFKGKYIKEEVELYIKRNNPRKDAVYYIEVNRRNDTAIIEMSSAMHRELIDRLAPCELIKLNGSPVLIKHYSCKEADAPSYIKEFVRSNLKDYKPIIKIRANGDTVEYHENIFYDPEVMTIYLRGGLMITTKANDAYLSN
ncbi:hypothetical protein [Hymenobacter norwichensis]|uniref:hypothetical protein n=1 Tax=Hymenobacter norwichensis TaxID=223903 RepID=UPI0012FC2D38|nr:hypothetical protein [Hymenobacter norwichensis]